MFIVASFYTMVIFNSRSSQVSSVLQERLHELDAKLINGILCKFQNPSNEYKQSSIKLLQAEYLLSGLPIQVRR